MPDISPLLAKVAKAASSADADAAVTLRSGSLDLVANLIESSGTLAVDCARGLDDYGIPAPLLVETGVALRGKGVRLWLASADDGGRWFDASHSAEVLRELTFHPIRQLRLRVEGADEEAIGKGLQALVDCGSPEALKRASMLSLQVGALTAFQIAGLEKGLSPEVAERLFWQFSEPAASRWFATADLGRTSDSGPTAEAAPDKRPGIVAWSFDGEALNALARFLAETEVSSGAGDTPGIGRRLGQMRVRAPEVRVSIVVQNKLGIHARPADKIVTLLSRFKAEVLIEKEGEVVEGDSIMGIMMLAAGQGTVLTVRARGTDATAALDALRQLMESKFGEES